MIKIVELEPETRVQRALMLVKITATTETRSQVLDTIQLFRAKVVDVSTDTVVVQLAGNTGKLNDFLRVIEPFGIRELSQSGMVGMGRGSRSISERSLRSVAVPAPPSAV